MNSTRKYRLLTCIYLSVVNGKADAQAPMLTPGTICVNSREQAGSQDITGSVYESDAVSAESGTVAM